MKKILTSLLLITFFIACDNDDDKKSNDNAEKIAEVKQLASSGSWVITLYSEDGVAETNNYGDYDFTFGPSNTLIASDGANDITGSWSVTDDDSDDDDDNDNYDDIDFNISFSSPAVLAELSEDWEIISISSTKIELRHDDDDNGVDLLTFEVI